MQLVIVSYYDPAGASRYESDSALKHLTFSNRGIQMNTIIFKIMMLNEQIKAFRKDEKGVTMIEYGLIATLIALACVATITSLGTTLNTKFEAIVTALTGATATAGH